MVDEPLNLGFEEAATPFVSASQNARVWTEQWVGANLFCPNCGAPRVHQFPGNRKVADFFCRVCAEEFELKSQKGRFGPRVVDGAFGAMCQRLASSNNPSLILMNYDLARFGVTDLFFVPKHFFVREIIQERKPLAPTARRAGWVGCNILLGEIPSSGKIFFVRDGATAPRGLVMEQWRSTLFLKDRGVAARGWLIEVMKCVEMIGRGAFTLEDVYGFEGRLKTIYPGNQNVRPKMRQQLQVLRDQGYLDFLGRGRYRVRVAK
ncbi:MAG: restriction endonuclease [Pseudomonadota bacterium]|nr:restriction endonuclease [Pseudomonadota bacterium]